MVSSLSISSSLEEVEEEVEDVGGVEREVCWRGFGFAFRHCSLRVSPDKEASFGG